MPSREVQVLVNVLAIQVRAGGRVVTALRGITDALETRREVRREVNTLLAGTKATVVAVAGLGALMLLLVNTFSEGGLRTVLENPIGIVLFAVCGAVFGVRAAAGQAVRDGGRMTTPRVGLAGSMSLVFAAIFTGLVLLAVRGWRLAGDPGVGGDLVAETIDERRERTSLVGKLLKFLDRTIGGRAVRGTSSRSRRSVQRALERAGQLGKSAYEDVIPDRRPGPSSAGWSPCSAWSTAWCTGCRCRSSGGTSRA